MKWLFDLIGEVLRDLYRNVEALLLYHSASALLSFSLLAPLLSWAISFMASSTGRLSVSNWEVFSFLLSVRGSLFIALVGGLAIVTLYLEHAGMMLIAWHSIARRPLSAWRAFWAVMGRLPALTILGSYHIAAHAILLAPFVVLGTLVYRYAFSSMRLYFLFLENPAVRWIGLVVALLLVAGIVVVHGLVYLHWMFSLPALLVDNLSARSALTYTRNLLKGTRRRMGAVIFLFWTVIVLLPLALAQGFYWLGGSVFARLPEEHRLVMPVVLVLMAGYLAASFIGKFLTVALTSLTITRLYAALLRTRDMTKEDVRPFRAAAGPQDRRKEKPEHRLPSGAAQSLAWHLSRPPHARRIAAFLVLAAVVSLSIAATILSGFELRDSVKITAHRGSSFAAPENTLAAIGKAIEQRADYAEVDVRLTADGYAVLLHDRDLFRVAGVKMNLDDLTYEQVRTLDAGSWFAPEFRQERIPLLSDVLDFCKGRIRLNIDLKVDGDPHRPAERIVQILQKHDAIQECVVSSASIQAIEHIRMLDPSIRTGYIISQSLGKVAALDVDFLSVSSRQATPGLISAAQAAGKEVHIWIVNKPRQMTRFIDLGADNLITDVPHVARAVLDERRAMSNEQLLFVKVRSWFLK